MVETGAAWPRPGRAGLLVQKKQVWPTRAQVGYVFRPPVQLEAQVGLVEGQGALQVADGQGDGANLGLRMDGRRGGFHGIVSQFPGRVVAKAVAGKSWRPGPGPGHR